MSNTPDPGLVKAFRAAKSFLERNAADEKVYSKTHYICWALETAEHKRIISVDLRIRAQRLIQERLRFPTVGGYLNSLGVPKSQWDDADLVQWFRHAWLDELIKEFSA